MLRPCVGWSGVRVWAASLVWLLVTRVSSLCWPHCRSCLHCSTLHTEPQPSRAQLQVAGSAVTTPPCRHPPPRRHPASQWEGGTVTAGGDWSPPLGWWPGQQQQQPSAHTQYRIIKSLLQWRAAAGSSPLSEMRGAVLSLAALCNEWNGNEIIGQQPSRQQSAAQVSPLVTALLWSWTGRCSTLTAWAGDKRRPVTVTIIISSVISWEIMEVAANKTKWHNGPFLCSQVPRKSLDTLLKFCLCLPSLCSP